MAIFSHSSFTVIVSYCKDELENVSKYIGKYLGEGSKRNFIAACSNYDCSEMNRNVEQLFCKMTGMTNSKESLNRFAEKFSEEIQELEDVFDTSLEEEKILILDRYSDRMLEIIEGSMK